MMLRRKAILLGCVGLIFAIVFGLVYASAATNLVPETGLGVSTQAITANDLKPTECAALDLAVVVTTGTASSQNTLLMGDATSETLQGWTGDDCILGGAGDDQIDGGGGYDICIGGAGENTFLNCEEEW